MADESLPEGTTFKTETIAKLLQTNFKDEKTKLSSDATKLTAELLKLFVQEAIHRAAKQAKNEPSNEVTLEHFEKILPQLLLDF